MFHDEHECRAKCGDSPSETCGQKGLPDRVDPADHLKTQMFPEVLGNCFQVSRTFGDKNKLLQLQMNTENRLKLEPYFRKFPKKFHQKKLQISRTKTENFLPNKSDLFEYAKPGR